MPTINDVLAREPTLAHRDWIRSKKMYRNLAITGLVITILLLSIPLIRAGITSNIVQYQTGDIIAIVAMVLTTTISFVLYGHEELKGCCSGHLNRRNVRAFPVTQEMRAATRSVCQAYTGQYRLGESLLIATNPTVFGARQGTTNHILSDLPIPKFQQLILRVCKDFYNLETRQCSRQDLIDAFRECPRLAEALEGMPGVLPEGFVQLLTDGSV